AADRLARVEAAYKGSVFPGLDALGVGLIRTRETTVNTDIQLKERELFAKLDKDGGPKSAMGLGPENPLGLRPAKQSLASLTARRQAGVASLLQAEELLDRAMAKLKDVPAAPSRYWYLADLVTEAQDAVRQAAEKGLAVAKAEEAVARDKGACWEAIRALEAYGGAEGKGSFDDASRLNAINLSNAAKRKHVENEYQYASRVEEARTWDYMLDLFAKL
ncbi:MAG TPA: hypothetical protein VNI01_14035, partial [Elusimicrobiota bacterium]|nr:hypothetical protein [Elusimicrobiota bacterium]